MEEKADPKEKEDLGLILFLGESRRDACDEISLSFLAASEPGTSRSRVVATFFPLSTGAVRND